MSKIELLRKLRAEETEPKIPENWEFIGPKRYRHQLVAFWYGVLLESCGLFLDMGTGKTCVSIDISSYNKDQNYTNKTLIVSPTTVLYNWQKEISKFSDKEGDVLYGPLDYRRELIHNSKKDYLILNYEMLRTLAQDLSECGIDMIIFDESTRIKNPKAQVTKAAAFLASNINYKLLLSGQPIANTPLDLFSQFYILNGGSTFGTNYFAFRRKYFNQKKFYKFSKWDLKKGAMPIISKKMYETSVRYLIDECIDLPSKTYQTYELDMSQDQRELYNKIGHQIITEIAQEEELEGNTVHIRRLIRAQQAITKMTKLAQVCSGFIYDSNGKAIYLKSNPKLDQLKDLILSLVRERKVIVWCRFKETIRIISNMLKKEKIGHVRYSGDENPKEKEKAGHELQTNSSIRVLVGQERSGIGTTFTAANYAIYVENEWSNEARHQSEKRIYRIGQERKVVIIDLIMKNSVEEKVLEALKSKVKIASVIMKDPITDFMGVE